MGFLGEQGYGQAGVQLLDASEHGGVIRVNREAVDVVKSGLMMMREVQGTRSAVRSVRVSGMLHKVRSR